MMSRTLRKWNYEKHDYDYFEVPDDYKLKLYTDIMEEIINCPHCGTELEFGDAYKSMEIHTYKGLGYNVCGKCYQKELERRRKAEQALKKMEGDTE